MVVVVGTMASGSACSTPAMSATWSTVSSGSAPNEVNGPVDPSGRTQESAPTLSTVFVHLDSEAVRQPGEQQRHGEHHAGADHRDQELPVPVDEVAEGDDEHQPSQLLRSILPWSISTYVWPRSQLPQFT